MRSIPQRQRLLSRRQFQRTGPRAGLQAGICGVSISCSPAKNGAASSNLGSSIVPYGARGGKRGPAQPHGATLLRGAVVA